MAFAQQIQSTSITKMILIDAVHRMDDSTMGLSNWTFFAWNDKKYSKFYKKKPKFALNWKIFVETKKSFCGISWWILTIFPISNLFSMINGVCIIDKSKTYC